MSLSTEDRRSAAEPRPVDFRRLLKNVELLVRDIESGEETASAIHRLADRIVGKFRDELGMSGGRLYRREGEMYRLVATFADARPFTSEVRVPVAYAPVEAVLADGVVYMDRDDPRLDREIERHLGVERFAAIEVGEGDFLLSFDIAPGQDGATVLYSLGVLRHAINQKLRQERMQEVFEQARKIQSSILPRRVPTYGDFDMAGATRPVETVGGDFYDYIPITDKILGLAIADVSGHGLPAALQVRDVYMGLRMGMARDFKIVRTVERLNSIIHKSTLTSRFVSVFYGELELNGVFIYVNAGHPPPFHVAGDGSVRWLEEGGAVLGPIANATYERGFVRLQPGDLLVFYTDGIIEATNGALELGGEEFGEERLVAAATAVRDLPAREIVDEIFAAVERFAEGTPPEDDRTVVVVRYPAAPA